MMAHNSFLSGLWKKWSWLIASLCFGLAAGCFMDVGAGFETRFGFGFRPFQALATSAFFIGIAAFDAISRHPRGWRFSTVAWAVPACLLLLSKGIYGWQWADLAAVVTVLRIRDVLLLVGGAVLGGLAMWFLAAATSGTRGNRG